MVPSKIYSTAQTAFDLYHVVQLLSKRLGSPKKAILYTFSTGKTLVDRMAQATSGLPFPFDGIILDGFGHTLSMPSTWRDNNYAQLGDQLLTECSADPFCSSKFAPQSVRTVLTSVYAKQYGNYNFFRTACLFNYVYTYGFKQNLANLLTRPEGRKLIFPILYRLNRCSNSDISFLAEMTTLMSTSTLYPYTMFDNKLLQYPKTSIPIFAHALANEYLSTGATPIFGSTMFDLNTRSIFQLSSPGSSYANSYTAATDIYRRLPFNITQPVLVLQSRYDPLTPLSNFNATTHSRIYTQLTRKILSRNDHIVAMNTVVGSSYSCGAEIIREFVETRVIGLSSSNARSACQSDGTLEDSITGFVNFNYTFPNNTQYGKMMQKDLWEGTLENNRIVDVIVDVVRAFMIQFIRVITFVLAAFLLFDLLIYVLLILLIAAAVYAVRQSNKPHPTVSTAEA